MKEDAGLRRGAATALLVFGLFVLLVTLRGRGIHSPLSWLPLGVTAALLIRWGRPIWPWAAAGAALAGFVLRQPPYGALAGALMLVSGPWLMAWMLERSGFSADFARRGDVLRFVLATPLAMLVPATLTLLAMAALAPSDDARLTPFAHWIEWWQNGTIAVMLVAPALLAAHRGLPRAWAADRYPALALLLATAVFCAAIFVVSPAVRAAWFSPIGVLIIVFSAIRMDLTFTGLLTLAMTASVSLSATLGPVPTQSPSLATTRVWAFCMVLAGIMLIMRALMAERDALDRRLRETEARYRHGLLEAAAREQERIGRDVHDSLGQELTAISLLARSLEARARDAAPQLRAQAEEIVQTCWRAVQSARAIARGLVPSIEHGADLVHALRVLAERVATAGRNLEIEVVATPGLEIPAETARNLYRIAQEALNNVLKHSGAQVVTLRLGACTLGAGQPGVRLAIEDDGIGLVGAPTADAPGNGLGQRTMQYRAEVSGGAIRFESLPAGGTRVVCEVPLPAPDAPRPAETSAALSATPDGAAKNAPVPARNTQVA